MAASFPCAATFWVVYESTKSALAAQVGSSSSSSGPRPSVADPMGHLSPLQRVGVHAAAAAAADVFVIAIRNPFEVVKQQMQVMV